MEESKWRAQEKRLTENFVELAKAWYYELQEMIDVQETGNRKHQQ